jgi:Fe-S oxidoreductase
MYRTMELCVSCKGCKRECPTGVDMAKMKVEFLGHYKKKHGLTLRDRLIAFLPRYAPLASRFSGVMNLRNVLPGMAALSEKFTGLSAKRSLPTWHGQPFRDAEVTANGKGAALAAAAGREVVLLVDTFNRYFEPENARAAVAVLQAAGYTVHTAKAADGDRPLCCGRTFLSAGLVDEAKAEARRSLDALKPFVERGVPVVGLEPSCLLGLRDEWQSMLPKSEAGPVGAAAFLFEEFLANELSAGRLQLPLKAIEQTKAVLHGHCHQKSFDAMPAVERVLKLVPGLSVETIESTCCGMAGGFGYEAEHYETSMKIGELSVLPKMRAAAPDALLVADGTSCRHQIRDGAQRGAVHVARVLERALVTGDRH